MSQAIGGAGAPKWVKVCAKKHLIGAPQPDGSEGSIGTGRLALMRERDAERHARSDAVVIVDRDVDLDDAEDEPARVW